MLQHVSVFRAADNAARARGEDIGRRAGVFHGPRLLTVLGLHEPPLQGAALTAAITEAIVTLAGHLVGQAIPPEAIDGVIAALVPQLRAYLEAEESDERLGAPSAAKRKDSA
jgi:hypothetical protein